MSSTIARLNRVFLALIITCIAVSYAHSQSLKSYKNKLEKFEKDHRYIHKAIEYGSTTTQKKGLSEGLFLYDLALERAKKAGGRKAQSVISLKISQSLLECCYDLPGVNDHIIQNVINVVKKDKQKLFKTYVFDIIHKINSLESDPQLLGRVYDNVSGYASKELIQELKETNTIAVKSKSLKDELVERTQKVDSITTTLAEINLALSSSTKKVDALSQESDKMTEIIALQEQKIKIANYKSQIDSISNLRKEEEIQKQIELLDIKEKANKNMKIALGFIALSMLLIAYFLFKTLSFNRAIKKEKERSEELLLNILPPEIAQELKTHGQVEPQQFDNSSILFLDFAGFSHIAKSTTPKKLIADLNYCFSNIDEYALKHQIVKIKTIGDAYMCVTGINQEDSRQAAKRMVAFARDTISFLQKWNKERHKDGKLPFSARIGIHTGPVAAGVVGKHKFCYDIWGDAVNVAARIESNGVSDKICISRTTQKLLGKNFDYIPMGEVDVKNMDPILMYHIKE